MELYFKGGDKAKNVEELFELFFSNEKKTFPQTFYDKELHSTQCYTVYGRSFHDIFCVVKTYFPDTTEEEFIKLLKTKILYIFYCSDVKHPVIRIAKYRQKKTVVSKLLGSYNYVTDLGGHSIDSLSKIFED